ncbi:MAG: hypothetical protein OXN16_10850, partial [Gammaproteobacteria bacterium]|nr:hypothetical protein [Gammaproteobacteria bacterium]
TIYCSPTLQQNANSLVSGALRLKESLEQQKTWPSFSLSIDPNWKVDLSDEFICGPAGQTELHFGGEIFFKDFCLERQALTVVILFNSSKELEPIYGRPQLCSGENHVVRRFHFDFDRSVANGIKPLAHSQFGGQLNSHHILPTNNNDSLRYELFDQLDFPRIPSAIVDLPIVLHTFLYQFPTHLNSFFQEDKWKKHVIDSERLWFLGYFQKAIEMMETEDRKCLYDYSCSEFAYES